MPHSFAIVLGMLIVCLWIGDATHAESSTNTLAVVSGEDVDSQALADLLSAELSRYDDISLVERDRIRAVLSELKLNASGLDATERQVQLGRIIAADVVLFVEKTNATRPPSLHVSSVETRTGLQLTSVFVPANSVDELENVASDTIRAVLEQSRIPDDERLYVAVAGVHSEEPGQKLTPTVRALTSALVHDLQHTPRVFVLERKRLQQLTAERDLAGIELTLKSSTRLIEAGLRSDPSGQGYRVSIALTTSGGQVLKRTILTTESTDFESNRQHLYQGVIKLLDGVEPLQNPSDRKLEARQFAALAQWLYSNSRYEEAVDAAESAFALDATEGHCRFLHRAHGDLIRLAMGRTQTSRAQELSDRRRAHRQALYEALVSAKRCHDLDMFYLQQPKPTASLIPTPLRSYSLGVNGNPFNPHVPQLYPRPQDREPPVEPAPQRMQELRQEYDALRLGKHRLLTEREKGNPRLLAELAIDELTVVDYYSKDGADYVSRVLTIQQRIDRHAAVLESQGGGGPVFFDGRRLKEVDMVRRANSRKLAEQLNWVYENHSSTTQYHPQWSTDEMIPLWMALMEHDEPKISVLGCLELSSVDKYRDAAVQRGLEVLPEVDEYGVELCEQVRKHLGRTDELEAIFEGVIARAEKANAPAELTHRRPLILALFGAIGTDRGNWRDRIEKLLTGSIPPRSPLARDANLLREFLKQQELRMAPPTAKLGFELTGAWGEYDVRVVTPKLAEREGVVGICPAVSQNADAGKVLWAFLASGAVGKLVLEGSGTVDIVAHTSRAKSGFPFSNMVCAADSDAVYLVTQPLALYRVDLKSGKVSEWTAKDGLIGDQVTTMTVHQSKVYMGLIGGVSMFDPATEAFQLLASGSSVERNSKLDGAGFYFLRDLVSDEASDCLWFPLRGPNGSELNGLWRYTPKDGRFDKHVDNQLPGPMPSNLSWIDNQLFFLHRDGWRTFDPMTDTVSTMTGYAPYLSSIPPNYDFVRAGDHIVQANGRLYSPDGKVHDLRIPQPWRTLLPTSNGFVALRSASHKPQILAFTRKETKFKE